MDGGTIAGLEDLPNDLEPGLEVKTPTHDDVVNVCLGECLPHILHSGATQELDTRHLELLLHVVNDGSLYAEKQDPSCHACSPAHHSLHTGLRRPDIDRRRHGRAVGHSPPACDHGRSGDEGSMLSLAIMAAALRISAALSSATSPSGRTGVSSSPVRIPCPWWSARSLTAQLAIPSPWCTCSSVMFALVRTASMAAAWAMASCGSTSSGSTRTRTHRFANSDRTRRERQPGTARRPRSPPHAP